MTEQELVQALRLRDAAAQRHFVDLYRQRVYAVAFRMLRDEWDAEEAAQDALFTVCNKIELFHGDSAFWSWVFRITENCARMKMRTFKRRPLCVDDDTLNAMIAPLSIQSPRNMPDDILRERRLVAAYQQGLDQADPTNRDLYVAMDIDGRTKEEVAKDLSLSIPALKARLHRIRESLKHQMLAAA